MSPTLQAFLWRAGDALGIDVDLGGVDGTLARLRPAAVLAETTVRNSATPSSAAARSPTASPLP